MDVIQPGITFVGTQRLNEHFQSVQIALFEDRNAFKRNVFEKLLKISISEERLEPDIFFLFQWEENIDTLFEVKIQTALFRSILFTKRVGIQQFELTLLSKLFLLNGVFSLINCFDVIIVSFIRNSFS